MEKKFILSRFRMVFLWSLIALALALDPFACSIRFGMPIWLAVVTHKSLSLSLSLILCLGGLAPIHLLRHPCGPVDGKSDFQPESEFRWEGLFEYIREASVNKVKDLRR